MRLLLVLSMVACRLAGPANSAGAEYMRYADDPAFSGGKEFARRAERFSTHVAVIPMEEGFSVQNRKTRVMRRAPTARRAHGL